MEIGSEFWINGGSLTEYKGDIPDWINKYGNSMLTSSGRGAISLLLKEVEERVIVKTALLPVYICNSVLQPFLMQDYKCFFYDINLDLTPDKKSIAAYGDVGVFLHMGYYGFPTNYGLGDIVKGFKAQSTLVVEDITHTLFSDYSRFEENDYYIGSIRKWVGIPSGGFLASPNRAIQSELQHNDVFASIRREALILKACYINSENEALKQKYLELFAKGEAVLDSDAAPYHIDTMSKTIMNNLNVNELKEKRSVNYKLLEDGLKAVKYTEPVFKDLPKDVCPFFYPVYLKKGRNEIRQKLIEQSIYCPIHWPVSEHIQENNHIKKADIYDTILSIPCDQRYGADDMERVVSVLRR